MKNVTFVFLLFGVVSIFAQGGDSILYRTRPSNTPLDRQVQPFLSRVTTVQTTSSSVNWYDRTSWVTKGGELSGERVEYPLNFKPINHLSEWRDTTEWVSDPLSYVDSAKVRALIWSGSSVIGVELKVMLNFSKIESCAIFFPLEPQGFKWFGSNQGELSSYAYFLGPFRVKSMYVLHILEIDRWRKGWSLIERKK